MWKYYRHDTYIFVFTRGHVDNITTQPVLNAFSFFGDVAFGILLHIKGILMYPVHLAISLRLFLLARERQEVGNTSGTKSRNEADRQFAWLNQKIRIQQRHVLQITERNIITIIQQRDSVSFQRHSENINFVAFLPANSEPCATSRETLPHLARLFLESLIL